MRTRLRNDREDGRTKNTMAVSIREVAAKAGVSTGTVSHVLNGDKGARIAPSTQERVRLAARDLGYRPNRIARSLGRGRTDTIALLVSGLQNSYFVEVLEAAERLIAAAGFDALVDSAPSEGGTYQRHGVLRGAWPVDGALVWARPFQSAVEFLGPAAAEVPVVYLCGPRTDDSDWVSFDFYQGGRQATEHLVTRGYKRIAYVAPVPFGEGRRPETRHMAYKGVLHEAGLSPSFLLTDGEQTRAAGFRAGQKVAAMPAHERPDALFCHNDMLAIGALCGLRRAGLQVPGDVAIVGFDGVEDAAFQEVPLTTVRTPAEDLCRRALEILARRITGTGGEAPRTPENVILPTRLIVGEST